MEIDSFSSGYVWVWDGEISHQTNSDWISGDAEIHEESSADTT